MAVSTADADADADVTLVMVMVMAMAELCDVLMRLMCRGGGVVFSWG
jgi:hypothetical protein